jgi:(1->4)-alpha-D-glucan 1-alpha-D-glucosylmutase
MGFDRAQRVPTCTYRVQLNASFTFEDLATLVPYLHQLGVGDVYCSPIFAAAPGSTHGYDVSDYSTLNPELGGEAGFALLTEVLKAHGMGVLLDFVPNHMGINGPFNAWWLDVLECGRFSPYGRFFDIHWNGSAKNGGRILVPMLEDHYGVVLEQGKLGVQYEDGGFWVKYGETRFPLCPESYQEILEPVARTLPEDSGRRVEIEAIVAGIARLPKPEPSAPREDREKRAAKLLELKTRLKKVADDAGVRGALTDELAALNGRPGGPASFARLDALLSAQHYRLARWKVGAHETNYRRFFAIDTLVGLRMEKEEVFNESHRTLAKLLAQKKVSGLRIDHIDGLWDPLQYLERLQALAPPDDEGRPLYLLVEKIIEGDERLPVNWPVHGTTGYEFPAQMAALLTDRRNEARFTRLFAGFSGDTRSIDDVVYESKRLILEEMFANAVNNLAYQLDGIVSEDRRWRDLTRHELTVAIREIMAGLAVYRTYRRPDGDQLASDAKALERACESAIARNRRLDPEPFRFLRDALIGRYRPSGDAADLEERLLRWVLTFQQYTGAVMAKSVEDTAFYVYNRLIGLNEVGGDPALFGGTVEMFHRANRERRDAMPLTMLATSTHDTKLSEDARARLYALSEIPDEWSQWLLAWQEANAGLKSDVGGLPAPDANEEYRLYQTLLAAWPVDANAVDEAFRERIRQNLRKAVGEAKRNTTWIHTNEQWLEACDRFVDAILENDSAFLASFRPKAARLAHLGAINSLTQTVLKLTSPGVPDLYQGNELWDFSLVDPDNRRPVDFARRRRLLEAVVNRSPRELMRGWADGAVKLRTTAELLRFRREHADLFSYGDYVPLEVRGTFAAHAVAFRRQRREESLVVVVPRLTAKLGCPPLGLVWTDTAVSVGNAGNGWRDLFTGAVHAGNTLPLAELFSELPFAVLYREKA